MEVRLLSIGNRGFFLTASLLNSVAPNEKKNSGTQGNKNAFNLHLLGIFMNTFLPVTHIVTKQLSFQTSPLHGRSQDFSKGGDTLSHTEGTHQIVTWIL